MIRVLPEQYVLTILATSAIALAAFTWNGNVDWQLGGFMAIGSILGGFLGAKVALNPLAKVWTFRLLVTIILLELVHMGVQYFHQLTQIS